ncbi:hypothetical protein RQP46_001368 [Phenoliferia psychrophenolica]
MITDSSFQVHRSRLAFYLSVALSTLFLILTWRSHTSAKIIHITNRPNPSYTPPLIPAPKFNIWREVKPTTTLLAAPSIATVDVNLSPLFHRTNATIPPPSKPTDAILHFHYEIDEEELARQTAYEESHPELVPKTLADEYLAYRAGGASGSLDASLYKYYINNWIKNWKLALPGDAIFVGLVFWTVGFLRDDWTSGVASVRRCAYYLLALWYITSTAMMIGKPKPPESIYLITVFMSLTDLIPKVDLFAASSLMARGN